MEALFQVAFIIKTMLPLIWFTVTLNFYLFVINKLNGLTLFFYNKSNSITKVSFLQSVYKQIFDYIR